MAITKSTLENLGAVSGIDKNGNIYCTSEFIEDNLTSLGEDGTVYSGEFIETTESECKFGKQVIYAYELIEI